MSTTYRITAVRITDFKRIREVVLEPGAANLFVIGGRNAQGKSSALDAVAVALGGLKLAPAKPIREGAEKAEIAIDIGAYKIRRTFTRRCDDEGNDTGEINSTLTVTTKDGAKYGKAQALLDGLLSATTIDPLAFLRQAPREQAATLRAVTGLDFTAIDAERQRHYDERTAVGREVKRLEGAAETLPHYDDAPDEERSASTLLAEVDAIGRRNRARGEQRKSAIDARTTATRTAAGIERIEADIARLIAERDRQREVFADQDTKASDLEDAAEVLIDEDDSALRGQIDGLDPANAKVRANAARAKAVRDAAEATRKYAGLTSRIEAIDTTKAAQLAAVAMPVPGLGFDAGGVTLGGLPFAQASQAEQFRCAVAMACAQNPALPWMPCRDGSLLDDDSMELLRVLAEERGAQVWIERVGHGAECSVVIDDGRVAP